MFLNNLKNKSVKINSDLKAESIIDFSPTRELKKKDLKYIIYGACFIGSGGGGGLNVTLQVLDKMISEDSIMKYINPSDLDETKYTAMVADIGGPEMMLEGYGQTAPINAFESLINMYKDYSYEKKDFAYLIPGEMGPISILIPFMISSRNKDITVVNGDLCGRAVPKLSMTNLKATNLMISPIFLAADTDDKGYKKINFNCVKDADQAEEWARTQLPELNNFAGFACYPIKAFEYKTTPYNNGKIINFTVGMAYVLGKVAYEDKNYDKFMQVFSSMTNEYREIVKGTLKDVKKGKDPGFDCGKVIVENENKEDIYVYYLNENLLAYNFTKKQILTIGPDSINYITTENGQPFSNTDIKIDSKNEEDIKKGTKIAVIGVLANEKMQKKVITNEFVESINQILKEFPEDEIPEIKEYIPITKL